MVMSVRIDQRGMQEAAEMVRMIAALPTAYTGVEWVGDTRSDGKNNAEIVEYLAEGGRDITATNDDSAEAGRAFVAMAQIALQRTANKSMAIPTAATGAKALKAANAAKNQLNRQVSAMAWRAASKVIQKKLADRIDRGEDNTGNKKQVTEDYAWWRQRTLGVPDDVVLFATGQLQENFLGVGALRLVRT